MNTQKIIPLYWNKCGVLNLWSNRFVGRPDLCPNMSLFNSGAVFTLSLFAPVWLLDLQRVYVHIDRNLTSRKLAPFGHLAGFPQCDQWSSDLLGDYREMEGAENFRDRFLENSNNKKKERFISYQVLLGNLRHFFFNQRKPKEIIYENRSTF